MMRSWKFIRWYLVGFICLVLMVFCTGCAQRVVTVPEYHYESHNTTDTVMLHDSILRENNTIIREADSTMLSELGIRLKQGERAILVLRKELERALSQQKEVTHDTVIKTDSIRVPYPVEKPLSLWQKFTQGIGFNLLLGIVCLGGCLLWIKNRRKS